MAALAFLTVNFDKNLCKRAIRCTLSVKVLFLFFFSRKKIDVAEWNNFCISLQNYNFVLSIASSILFTFLSTNKKFYEIQKYKNFK